MKKEREWLGLTSTHLAPAPGANVSIFKAHSVRGASSTAATKKGVLIEDILRMADWNTDSTFRKFYYQPVHQTFYAQSVPQVETK